MPDQFIRPDIDWARLAETYKNGQPFPHIVIDDFFRPEVAEALERDIPAFEDKAWLQYNNAIEKKRIMNHWDKFPAATYRVMNYLNFGLIPHIKQMTDLDDLEPDIGLNGGGWHMHGAGQKLNVHLDYSIHPKLGLERRLNLIVYLSKNWKPEYGGALELWSHDPERKRPKEKIKAVECLYNRGVLFDTTMNSWHGLPEPLACPAGAYRKSLAVYYLTPARAAVSDRGKALFAPTKEQENDPEVLELIKRRSNVATAAGVYEKKP